MKRILFFSLLFVFANISNAQTIDSVLTTSPILCNSGVGDITVYTNSTGNVLYDLLYLNSSGNWQTMLGPILSFSDDFTISNIPGLFYRVRLLDLTTNLEIDTYDHLLIDPPSLFLNPSNGISSSLVSCFNGNDGTATINMMGGTSPYSYLWSNGQNTQIATGLSAGTYSCVITDTNGCVFIGNPVSVTISQPQFPVNPSLFSSIVNVACFDDSTGSISLSTSGGTAPYYFSWSNGDTTSSINNLYFGTYSVMVTDANGCSQSSFSSLPDSNQFLITQPSNPLSFTSSKVSVNCKGQSTGSISLNPDGGTSPYNYLWSNGSNLSTINNLIAGTYHFTITDANLCSLEDSISITEPDSIIYSNTSSLDVSCFGYIDGGFSVDVFGGTQPFSYLWSNGTINNSYNFASASTYSVVITDNNGCIHYDTVVVSQPNQISLLFSLDSISCPSGNDGVLYAQAYGGVPDYSYSWSTTNTNGISILNDSTIDQISEGMYTVVVDDINLCTETFSIQVTDPDPMIISAQIIDVSCNGDNNGSISANILGATPPFSFSWLPNGQTTSYVSSLIAGTYTVNVDDANNCYSTFGSASATFIVNEPNFPLEVGIDTTAILCYGQSNGTASAFPVGGTSPYTYLWSTSETSYSVNNLSSGSYSVIVEDANLCQHTVFFNMADPDELSIASSIVNPSCYGFNNGTALVTPSGGNGNYSYLWSNGHTGQSISGLAAGPIGVTVTDGTNICSIAETFQISEPNEIVVNVTTNDNLCFGGSSGTANSQVTDPFPPFSYLWSNLDTVPNISNLSAGTYNLTVRNANNCEQDFILVNGNSFTTSTFDILDPLTISLSSIVSDISVNGANDGSISVIASGGISPFTYSWSGPNNFSSTLSSLSSLSSGFYQLFITDLYGCTYSEQFVINEPNCNILIDTTYLPPLCYNDNAQELSWLNTGGLGPYTSELIDNNNNIWYGPSSGLNPVSLTNTLPPGLYTLSVSDMSGCYSTLNIPITQPDSLLISFVSTDIQCYGDNNGSLSAIASGGTTLSSNSYNYSWSPGNQSSFNISNLIAGTYSVVVTDANNCQISSSYSLIQPNELTIDSLLSTYISCNPGIDGSATVFSSGGVEPYYYSWNIPNNGITQTTQTASQLSVSGNYSVTVSDSNNCFISNNIYVYNAPSLLLTDSVIEPLCYNDSNGIIYANASGGTSPYSYSWSINGSPGLYSSSSFIANLSSANYSVIVEDIFGCINQFTTQISNPSLLTISSSVIDVSLNGANDGSINTYVSGGTGLGTYSYSWNGPNGFNSSLENISFLYAGTYTLVVVDGNGCSTTFLEVVNEPSCNLNFDSTVTYITQPLCFGQTGLITWMANGGGQTLNPTSITDNVSGLVLFSQTTLPNQIYNQNLSEGNYNIFVQDEFGCSDILNFTILSTNLLSANVTTDSVNCFGGSDGSILLEGIGGTSPYFINYGTDPITGSPIDENFLTVGNYTATITDINGCLSNPSFFNVEIFEPNQIFVNYTSNPVSCYGSSDGDVSISVIGGTNPYTYTWQGNLLGTNTPIVSNLTANDYFVEVSDINGCYSDPQITSVNISGPSNSLTVSINTVDASCYNFADGQAQAFASGGTSPYSYQWNNGQTSQIITGLVSGTYTCTVTDANGCINYNVTQLNEPNEININLTTNDISCFGLNDGYALVNPSGGSGNGFGILWSIIDPLTGLLNNNFNVSNIGTGVFSVTISDFSLPGCNVTSNFIISQPDMLQIFTNEENIVTCYNGNDGEISASVIGGISPYSYNWSTSINNSLSTSNFVSNLNSQMYYVDIIDSSGCLISDSIFLNSNEQINPNLSFNPVSCNGGNDGIAFVSPTGGSSPYTYFWSVTGSTSSSSTGLNANTNYSVQITDVNNCPTLSTTFTVPEPDNITMFVSVDSVSCYLGTDGQIIIDSVSGGVAPYSYLWSNGSLNDSLSNLILGSYNCIVTDAIGCTDSSNVYFVNEPNELISTISITSNYNGLNLNCFGDSTAELTVFSTGGNGFYTYLWSNGSTSSSIDSLPEGTYGVTVSDSKGCFGDDIITITNPDSIQIGFSLSQYNGSNISCYDFNDGSIDASITSGAPINYSSIIWTDINGNLISPLNIINDTSLINLNAGIYVISVSDINGCTSSSTVELFEPNLLINNYLTDSVTCYGGNDGIAYAIPFGGTAPYQISWSTGSNNDTVLGLNGFTSYYVQISDTNNCPMVLDTIQIPQPDILQTTEIITIPTCYGINDGQIIISSVSGATGPYTFQWNDILSSTGTILANINSGEYICTITDVLGCSEDIVFNVDTVFSVEVNVNITSDYNGLPLTCYGDTNASVLAIASGGTAPYSYYWLNSFVNDTLSYIDSLSNIGAGTYIAYTVDANGCEDFIPILINNPDSISHVLLTSDYNGFNISCDGYNDGFIDLSLSGGNGIDFNSLIWNTLDTITLINNLSIGNYSFSVNDINGCSTNGQITLNSPDPMFLELSSDSLSCFGDSNATIIIDSINNGITPLNYLWSDGQFGSTAYNLSSGYYSLLITDNNNCSINSAISVYEPNSLVSLLTVSSQYNGSQISCHGEQDAVASINSFGGITPYEYSVDSINFYSVSTFNNLGQGFFSVITKDSNGCLANDSALILHPDLISANLQPTSNPTCDGINNGEITSFTSGGTGLYYYQWSVNNNLTTVNSIDSLLSGLYTVQITDDNGCVISDTLLLDPMYNLIVNIETTQVTCTGYSDGTATINPLNGTNPFVYQWNNSMTGSNIFGLSAGNYIVFVTDSNGCQLVDSVTVAESDSVLSFVSTVIEPTCYLDSNGSISVNISGGLGDYVYTWFTGVGTANVGPTTDSSTTIINLISNTYILNVSDSVGCIVTDTFIINEPLPLTYNILSNDITCFGLNDGYSDIQLNGGTQPYNYTWSNSNNLISNNSYIDNLLNGIYNINVIDVNGCFIEDSIIIEEPELLTSSFTVLDPLCFNSNDGSILINVFGGTAPFNSTFGILNPNNIFADSIVYLNLGIISDTLYIYDNNNCFNKVSITLNQPTELEIFDFNSSDPSCYDYSNGSANIVAFNGTPPYTYQLFDVNNNIISSSSNVNNLSSGNYLFLVSDNNECNTETSFDIVNPLEISIIQNSITNVECNGDFTGSLLVDINNNIGSSQIIWSPIEFNTNSNSITDLSAGQYNIVVIDENGCTKVDSFEITQNDEIYVNIDKINSTCSNSIDGEIDLIINGGLPPYSIFNDSFELISNVFSSYLLDSLMSTSYNIIINDSYDCQLDTLISLDFNGGYDCINEPIIITPNFDGFNDIWSPIRDLDTEINVVILNRWGQKEYSYNGNSLLFSWDGLANWGDSRELSTADYYYIIKFNNNDFPAITGVITLIR